MDRVEQLLENIKMQRVVDYMRACPDKKNIPISIGNLLNGARFWLFAGQSVSLNEGDYGTEDEWRRAVEYLAHQFGGLVMWEDKQEEEGE